MSVAFSHCSGKTEEFSSGFIEHRIKILPNKKDPSAANSKNTGIKSAKGHYVAFLDADDEWMAEKLEYQIDFMIKNELPFSYTDYFVIRNGKKPYLFKSKTPVRYKNLLKTNSIGNSTVIVDMRKISDFSISTDAPKREDHATWLRIAKTFDNLKGLNEPLTKYYIGKGGVSHNKFKMIPFQWKVYRENEKLNVFKSLFCLICWGFNGMFKYR